MTETGANMAAVIHEDDHDDGFTGNREVLSDSSADMLDHIAEEQEKNNRDRCSVPHADGGAEETRHEDPPRRADHGKGAVQEQPQEASRDHAGSRLRQADHRSDLRAGKSMRNTTMSPPEAKRSWQILQLCRTYDIPANLPKDYPLGPWRVTETRMKATGFKGTQKKYICTHGMGHAYDKPCCKWEMVCEYVSEVEGEVAGWVVLRVMPEHNHDLDESCNLEEKRMRKQRKIANNFLFSMMHNEPYQPVGGSRAREEEASRKKIQSWLKELGLEAAAQV
ncbi:hypothetical protein GUITHDRAFT_106053 [Guillardia theta CCMP2712]|uniref:Uncharacterized protein n=1 Tax=Guillardia theta (strain CCMP2712) TaxID=905079 RepID=L1JHH2_GUITC|nr:hypothetical protein GUITHDRAFT_106053 [Guillardia theta CCMP2712]EKX47968.1 hypothetical protein GUITHDRAFT_106053 [Guillardia theta CCMP2712]|eukprot:XP_005834948.1 hypothetical protein GUITHDRAFT_106053 [Guillardia theta CCMP2712]